VSSLPFVKSGGLKGITTSGRERLPELPLLPTIREAALPGYSVYAWFGVFAPGGTPAPVVNKLNSELVRIVRLAEVTAKLRAQGGEIATDSPAEFAQFIRDEVNKWGNVIKMSGTRVD